MLPIFSSLDSDVQEALHEAITNLYKKPVAVPGVGEILKIGGERINSDDFIVFSLNGKLYELAGYYSSQEGTTWDDLGSVYEVKAVERLVTFYDKV